VVALLVYMFSIGPIAALTEWHYPSEAGWKVIDTVYHPLAWAAGKMSLGGRLTDYEVWWEERVRGKLPGLVIRRRPGTGDVLLEIRDGVEMVQ
jgi:hypothetical protein